MDKIFPIEIFLEIFQYISVVDLYYSWYNLNSRINLILADVKLSIDLSSDISQNVYKRLYEQSISELHHQIYYIRQYCPLIPNINQFINVRTLIIHYPSSDQLKQIKPTIFKYLTCLCIQYSPCSSKEYEHLCRLLFSGQFYFLKKCHLSYINEIKTIITSTSNIQSLTIAKCNKNDLYLIIKYLEKLKYLSVGIIKDETLATVTLKHLPSIISRKLTTLKLVIHKYQMHFYEFEYIASYLPNLNYLFVKAFDNEHLNFNRWQHVLSANLLKLFQFDCYFKMDRKPRIIPDINQIRQQHPLFTEIKCDDSGEGICFYTNVNAIPKFYW